MQFTPAAGAAQGTASFTYTVLESIGGRSQTAATYSILMAVADAQTSPVLSNSTGQKAIPTLTATSGTASPTNYRILTLPSTGTLYVNGTAATTNLLITAAQAAQLTFAATAGYFGTTSFTYAPADASGDVGDGATYAIPVTTAVCGNNNNSVLDFSRRTVGEDWTNHASVAVNASNITSGNYTSSGTSANSFMVDNNAALPGPSLAWRQVNTGFDPATSPNTSTVTFTFDKPVTNLSLSIQDIDQNITTTQAFTDALTLDGYSTAGSTTPIALTAANFALGNTNTFSGSNTVTGTGNSSIDPAGNIVVTFTSPVQRLTLTFKNIAPYTSATINRTHTMGITSMTWCRLAPVANNVTTATLPSTAGQVGISPLSSTVDGTVLTYTIVTIPNATTQGTLYYNSTGTTYAAVTAGRTLTAAQAASLRFAPVSGASGNTTFTYTVQDSNGQSSNTATYTIPVNNTPCATATSTFAFSSRPAGEDWKAHATVPAPAGSGFTTVNTSDYGTQGSTTTNNLVVGTFNGVQTLAWSTDYSSLSTNTSTVTFNFNRAVSNFAVQVQDIDTGTGFTDQVVFTGANGSTAVTPVLGPVAGTANTNTVAINGNTATGTVTNGSATTATVVAYFPSPITKLTLTYSNISTTQADPSNNIIGIDLLQFCRVAPVANDVTTATLLSSVGAASIASLASTVDGTAASYTLTSIPNASTQGVLSYNSSGTTYTNITAANQVLTAAQAASLRFTPVAGSSGNVTFGYKVTDDAGLVSANTATYTIPVSNATCATTGTLSFATQPVGDDWKAHAATPAPANSTITTISSSNYATPASATTSTLAVTSATATTNINGVQTLAWLTDYASQTANSSSVTFTFNRPVSNFAVRVQDIDKAETTDGNGNVANAFDDRVTFVGANGTTTVLPSLTAVGTANTVLISGNVATGTTNVTNTTDGTVMAYFASPITSLTLTYSNVSTFSTDPTNNAIGIELMQFCRATPVASNITNTSRPSGQGATAINSLSATADGAIASYTITALPPASQGTFYVNNVALTASTLTLTAAQAAQLTFAPAAGFSGNAGFSYYATDDAGLVSNTATYTVPVTNTGAAGTPAACATPGKDGSPTLSTNPNTYYPATASANATATSITVGVGTTGGAAAATTISKGDLLLVIQMQGADIDYTNTDSYGDGVTGGGASGNLTTNFQAGTYEYVVATNATPINVTAGGTITLASGLVNSYVSSAASATANPRSFQVVRVPQYGTLTLAGTLTALPWNGSVGGIIALDVAGQTSFGNNSIDASGRGFRGGGGRTQASAAGANLDYVGTTAANAHSQKGEGTAGTPRYVNTPTTTNDATTNATTDTGIDGYAGGSFGRGAPGNAGGGGNNNVNNSGGGGGANGGSGGRGGNNFGDNQAIGGEPGTYFGVVSSSRLVLGGGGGAGSTNNATGTPNNGFASSGAAGGGLVLLRTGSITGSGSILANGGNANNSVADDGSGGGGAGGTILVTASNTAGLANLTLTANGGKGGTNTGANSGPHGPGGGGGGGVILANGGVASISAAAGANGTTQGTPAAFGAAAGLAGVTNTQISSSIANSAAGTACVADVATTITGPATASAGQPTGNYTATFSATGASGAANVTQTVALPTGAGLTAAQQAAIVAAYPGTTFTTTGSGATINTTINFGTTTLLSGASNSFVFAYTAPTTAGTVSTASNTSTTTTEAGQTANNTASVSTTVATAADVTVSLTGPTTLNAGQPTGNFTATFTNEGIGTATTIARQVTLPTGASLTVSQQATIVAAYPSATFTTTGSGTTAVTTIDFGSVASLVNDASSAVTFAFTAPTTPATNLTLTGNTSTAVSEGTNSAPNQTTLALTTVATADVAATITGSTSLVGTAPAVATGTFNVAFTNNGPQTAAGVTRTVQLPTGLTGVVVSGNDAGTYNATTGLVTYTNTPVSLNSGASLTSTITFPIPATGGQVAATASVNTTTNEAGLTTNNSATAVMPAAYDLTTTISGPTTAVAGSPVTLYVTTTNNGPNTAPTALQMVSIPSSAPLTNVYITNGGTYTYNNTTKIGTVTFPDPANLASGVTATNLPSGQTIANSISFSAPAENFAPTATVALNSSGPGSGDLTPTNNTAYLNNGVAGTPVVVNTNTTALATANESTTLTTTSTIVSAGTSVTYKVAATNHGPGVATNVIEQVQLLPNLATDALTVGGLSGTLSGTTITYTSGGNPVATYSTTTGIVTYATLATQASGATQTFGDIVLTVPANAGNNGQLLATAAVRTSTNDPVPADNVSAVAVKVTSTADLASTVTGPSSVAAGQTASYTVAFTNNGTGTAGTVAETMQLPAGLGNTVVVQDPSGNVLAGAYNSTTGLVTFPAIASDAVGATQVYNVVFPAPGQSYSVSSSIGSGTLDNVGTNNASVLATTVTPAADVSVAVSGPATTTAGNAVTYAVTTINNGPDQATTVTPTIQLPMNLTGVVVVGGAYDTNTGKVTFTAYRLASGESRVSLVTFPMPTNPANGFVTGMAAVTTATSDLVLSNNTAGITTSVAPATPDQADLVTSVTGPTGPVAAGSPLTYTIKVSNGTVSTPAVNVVPTAYLPAGLTGVVVKDPSGNVLPNAYNSTTGQIIFPTIASLSAGTTPAYTVTLTAPAVTSPGANPTLITASAVSANTSDPNLTNNAVGNSLAISASFDEVTSLSGPTKALPGSTNTYTVTTTNNGPSTAPTTANTVQTVTLPAGVTATNISGGGTQSGNVITFPAISTTQATGANGAIVNTFSIVMPATGSLPLSATVTSTGESNTANDGATLTTAPTNQVPVADNVWNTLQTARGNTANIMASKGLPISPLTATDPDGTVASYTITSIPDASQGMLYYNGALVSAGQTVAASGLSFAPSATFVGNATFTYVAVDNGNAVSNTALYTIPVAQDMLAVYTAYNSTKGGTNQYVTGDVLAQVVDANASTYNSAGLIYDASTGVLQADAANGMPLSGTNATITSGTLPAGVSLDPTTGRIYVSKASDLVNNSSPRTYTVTITTVDSNGGVTTQPVSFTIGAYPLPVVLTAFTATAVQNRDALLSWTTASEKNNDHFEVERSFDGTSFTQIAKVAGHGTTTVASAYTLTDANVATKATGPVYYRLRQVDLDGSATYSPVRTVSFTAAAATPLVLSLYPNPAQASTTLELSELPATGTYQVTLLDATGRTVRSATLAGGLPQPLDISDLATGSYHVLVTGQLADGSALHQVLRLIKD